MREMFPDFYVHPIQALDTPQIHPRVVLWLPEQTSESPDETQRPRESITIDAFDAPLPIANSQRCWQAKQDHPDWTLDDIAQHLNLNRMTVKRSLGYARLMQERGTTDPYIVHTEKPAKASRWKAASQTGGSEPESAEQDAA
jgi:hypothetical protein